MQDGPQSLRREPWGAGRACWGLLAPLVFLGSILNRREDSEAARRWISFPGGKSSGCHPRTAASAFPCQTRPRETSRGETKRQNRRPHPSEHRMRRRTGPDPNGRGVSSRNGRDTSRGVAARRRARTSTGLAGWAGARPRRYFARTCWTPRRSTTRGRPRGLKLIKDIVWPVGERLEGEREPGQQRESGGLFYESQSSDAKAALV